MDEMFITLLFAGLILFIVLPYWLDAVLDIIIKVKERLKDE